MYSSNMNVLYNYIVSSVLIYICEIKPHMRNHEYNDYQMGELLDQNNCH